MVEEICSLKPIDENHPVRLQGSFISDDDVERIVNFIKAQADADYDESFDPGEVSEMKENFQMVNLVVTRSLKKPRLWSLRPRKPAHL